MAIDTLTENWGEQKTVAKFASMLPAEGMPKSVFLSVYKPLQLIMRQMIDDGSLVVSNGNVRLHPILKKGTPAPTWNEVEGFAFALHNGLSDHLLDEFHTHRLDLDNYPASEDKKTLLNSIASMVDVLKRYDGNGFAEGAEKYLHRMRDTVFSTTEDISIGNELLGRMKKAATFLEKDALRTAYEGFHANGGAQMAKTLQNILFLPEVNAAIRTTFYFDLLLYFIELDRPAAKLEVCKRYLQAASEQEGVDSFELSFVHRNAIWSYEEIYEEELSIAEYRSLLMKWTNKKDFAYEYKT